MDSLSIAGEPGMEGEIRGFRTNFADRLWIYGRLLRVGESGIAPLYP
jgi:hypothetical protein